MDRVVLTLATVTVVAGVLACLFAALWLNARDDLRDAHRRIHRLDHANHELRTQLNHVCEHRACRLARRIGLT